MLTILGCGNPNRSDDGAGVEVARQIAERLARHPVPGVRAFDCGTAGMEVMFAAKGSEALIIIDACSSDSEPGTIFEVPGSELEDLPDPGYSLHDFRWNHALAAGRKIFKEAMPTEVTVFLIEAQSLDLGLELSGPVAQAVESVKRRIFDRMAQHSASRHAHAPSPAIVVRRGNIRIPSSVYDTYFDGREGALFIEREGRLCLIPVEEVHGGIIIKRRTSAGDRVVDAAEFLRAKGWDAEGEYPCTATWDPTLGALALERPEEES